MAAKEEKIISIKKNLDLPLNEVRDILLNYFKAHSSGKFNYIYWNIIDQKHPKLLFVNLIGKDLIKVNNGDLRFRIVTIRNKKHWEVIKWFITTFLIDQNADKRSINVLRLDYIFSFLNNIKFDFDSILFGTNGYGSVMLNDGESAKILSYIDRDIQSVYLIENLNNGFSQFDDASLIVGEKIVTDIKQAYIDEKEFRMDIPNTSISISQIDGLDCASTTFIRKYPNSSLEALFVKDNISTKIISVFKSNDDDDISIITVRVYLSYFLGKRSNKNKKQAKGVETE